VNPPLASQRVKPEAAFVVRVRMALALLALISVSPHNLDARDAHQSTGGITILVYNYAKVPVAVLTSAERQAGKILGVASIELAWLDCAPASTTDQRCLRGWTKQTPGLRLITGFNKYQDRELGHADVPVLATIYYEKVVRRVYAENAESDLGTVLGALIAHELGHLLLTDPKHSTVGVMEPDWGRAQIRSARDGKLLFTAQQAAMLKRRLEVRDDADQDARSATLNIEIDSGYLVIARGRIQSFNDLKFIVDTGVTNTVIDRKLADKLRLRRSTGTVLSFAGFKSVQQATIEELQVGPLRATDLQVYVADLLRFSTLAKNVDGIVGMDVLASAKRFRIDYEQRTLLIEPSDHTELLQPVLKYFAVPANIQGLSTRLLVDTGFPGVLLYRDRLLRRLPEMFMGLSTRVELGRLHLEQVELPQVQVGSAAQTAKVFLMDGPDLKILPDVDGYLGPSFLCKKWVEFDTELRSLRWQ
jgi:predicted aspartyl protease